jgi:hypothetical protein
MNWADKVMETALAALAERTASAGRLFATTPWSADPQPAWLTRIERPREPAAPAKSAHAPGNPSTAARQDTAPRD